MEKTNIKCLGAFSISSGGGGTGGAVDSVNGQTGTVVLTGEDLVATVSEQENTVQAHLQTLADKDESLESQISELQLFKFPNAVIIGEPKINNGQVSNFSENNFLQFPFLVDLHNKPFQIDFAFTTGNDVTTQQNILDSQFGLALAIRNGKGLMAISHNGTSWAGEAVGNINIEPNTTYYARLVWDGAISYITKISIDGGKTYVDDMTFGSTQSPFPRTMYIGGCSGSVIGHTAHPFGGIIDLNKAYLYVDGVEVWQGMDDVGLATRADISLSNIDAAGEQKIKDIAGGDVPEGVYTKDNLIGGYNVTITEVPKEGGIDEHTLACWHCDSDIKDVVSGKTLYRGSIVTNRAKFGEGCLDEFQGYRSDGALFFDRNKPLEPDSDWTVDYWFMPKESMSQYLFIGTLSIYVGQGIYNGLGIGTKNFGQTWNFYGCSGTSKPYTFVNYQWYHLALQRKSDKLQFFINGELFLEGNGVTSNINNYFGLYSPSFTDEIRVSNIARYTSDFTPKNYEYTDATQEPTRYQINSVGGTGGVPSELWLKGNTGYTIQLQFDPTKAQLVDVFKNGLLLEKSTNVEDNDYTFNSTSITFATELVETDKITLKVY